WLKPARSNSNVIACEFNFISCFRKEAFPASRLISCFFRLLLPHPGAICHDLSGLVPHRLNAIDLDRPGNRPQDADKVCAHHGLILGVHRGRVGLVNEADDSRPAGLDLRRLVLEIDEAWCDEDEGENQRYHDVVVETAPVIGPEEIAFDGAPGSRHGNSVEEHSEISNQHSATQLFLKSRSRKAGEGSI